MVGSNVFNILGCLGLSTLIAPAGVPMAASVLSFEIWVVPAVPLACLPVMLSEREIARWEGLVFIGYCVAYTAYLILMSQQHDALPMFSNVMLMFFLPLTAVTLIASLLRKPVGAIKS